MLELKRYIFFCGYRNIQSGSGHKVAIVEQSFTILVGSNIEVDILAIECCLIRIICKEVSCCISTDVIDTFVRSKYAIRTYSMLHVRALSAFGSKDTDTIAYYKLSSAVVVSYATATHSTYVSYGESRLLANSCLLDLVFATSCSKNQ